MSGHIHQDSHTRARARVRCSNPSIHRWQLARLRFEGRLSLARLAALPTVSVLIAVPVMAAHGTPPTERAVALRTILELGLPPLGVFLSAPLLEREWAQGTLATLALRAPLMQVLLLRLLFSLAFLLGVASAVTLSSLVACPYAPDGDGSVRWLAGSLLAASAPTLLLIAVALLVTHALGSVVSGYLVAIAVWLASLVGTQALPPTSGWRALLLFGWTFPPPPGGVNWAWGKIILLSCALLLLAGQAPLLRHEARLIRDRWE